MFDTLVKLTYNMQVYAAALKLAITWNQNCNYNRNSQHYRFHKSSKTSIRSETIRTDDNSSTPMDLVVDSCDIPLSSSSMDLTESNIPSPFRPLFSQAVTLAKTIVFLSQDNDDVVDIDIDRMVDDEDEFVMHHDNHDDNIIGDDILDVSEDDEENMMLLESYGRRCTLPFLRFAALLKKYTNEDNDNLDDHNELTIILSSPQQHQHQHSNLTVEQQKQTETFLDSQTQPSDHHNFRHSSSSVDANYHDKDSSKNSSPHLQNFSRNHWSQDDNEFLLLARYLKLLNNVEETSENCNEENNSTNYCLSDDNHDKEIKQHIPLQPPSAMEAVIWPRWSYCTSDNSDNVLTTISRAWLTSFREALTTKIPRSTVICENTTTIVSSAAAEIDPNSNATTSGNILMAARLLLAVDCCAGGGSHTTSDSSDSTSDGSRSFLPTINWTGPRLLGLPYLYDDVFQYYHCRPCHRCHGVPRETSVCLVCGTVVCLKENCCKTNGISEAVQVRVLFN